MYSRPEHDCRSIDKAKCGKQKYNRRRIVDGQWVLWGIQILTKEIFLVPKKNCLSRTLVRILWRWLLPWTMIGTDSDSTFFAGIQLPYPVSVFPLRTVNQPKNFMNPVISAHTNNVKRKRCDISASIQSSMELEKANLLVIKVQTKLWFLNYVLYLE